MINPSSSAEGAEALIAQMTAAVAQLSWMSETDAPFEVLYWPDIPEDGLTVKQILHQAQLPPETPIEAIALEDFLSSATQPQPWHTAEDAEIVERFQQLQALIAQALTQVQVYRCGRVEQDIYVVGQTQNLGWLVLHTSAVES